MKTLWNALSFFCIVQVLAAGMFVAWLWQSKRLTRDRLEAARELFAPPDGESMAMSAADKGTEESADAASARSGSAGSGTGDAARTMRAASRRIVGPGSPAIRWRGLGRATTISADWPRVRRSAERLKWWRAAASAP